MELAFETKPLREMCESEEKAKRQLGAKVAAMLKQTLADLRAAASMEDLPFGKPRIEGRNCILDLTAGYQLTITPNHTKNPMLTSNAVDWTKVSRIKILRIGAPA